ncbi:MAG: hypothetical protein IT322_14575 [Anaerolineae bacterium]|nr:hypothetical protein [Anaerolineae bacterium]
MECPKHVVEMFIECTDDQIRQSLDSHIGEKKFTDVADWLINLAIANRPLLDGGEKSLEEWIAAGAFILAPSASNGNFALSAKQLQRNLKERPQWVASLLTGDDLTVWQALRSSRNQRPSTALPENDPHLAQAKQIALSLDSITDRHFRNRAGTFWDKVLDQAVGLIRDELKRLKVSKYERDIIHLKNQAKDNFPNLYPEARKLAENYAKERATIHTQVDMSVSALRVSWVSTVLVAVGIAVMKAIPEQNPSYYDLVYKVNFGSSIVNGSLLGIICGNVIWLRQWSNRKKRKLEQQMNITRS